MRLYCYAKAEQMRKPHMFTDDVAIVTAENKKEAIKVIRTYYSNCTDSDVFEVEFKSDGIAILTDY